VSPKTLIACAIAVLIAIIAATVANIVTTNRSKAHDVGRAQVLVDSIDAACDAYHLAMNKYPSSLNDVFGNPGDSDWVGPGLHHTPLVDPWG